MRGRDRITDGQRVPTVTPISVVRLLAARQHGCQLNIGQGAIVCRTVGGETRRWRVVRILLSPPRWTTNNCFFNHVVWNAQEAAITMLSPHLVLLMCGPDGLHANVSDVWTLAHLRRRAEACPALPCPDASTARSIQPPVIHPRRVERREERPVWCRACALRCAARPACAWFPAPPACHATSPHLTSPHHP